MFGSVPRWAGALLALALVALATPLATAAVAVAPALTAGGGSAVTATGSEFAYDDLNNTLRTDLPTATISQTQDLVDQTVHVSWTGQTPSTNSAFDPGATDVTYNPGSTYYAVGVYECKGSAPTSFADCFATSAGATSGTGGLGNAVKTVTYSDGAGYADLHVETGVTNSTLACDPTHPCSVAIVPAWGGDAPKACNDHSDDLPSEDNGYSTNSIADSNIGVGACSWANRITVALNFAQTPLDCPNGATSQFVGVGSPMLERGLSQWSAGWCHDSTPLNFSYNSTSSEYEARDSFASGSGALTSSTDVAFTTQPATGAAKGFTYSPVANTDIAITFVIDDPKTHHLIPHINLDARLVAKLLTQSYAPLAYNCQTEDTAKQSATCDPAVKGNPGSILKDPEFLALNPDLSAADFPYVGADAFGAFFPTVLAGNSDLTYELTSWIASDSDARAFLAGTPDKYGMHVNTYYKGIAYPTAQLSELDPGYHDPASGVGTGTMQNTWQPVTGLDRVGTLTVGNTSTSLDNNATGCATPPCSPPKLVEQLGARNLFAIMDQGQASAYDFPTASLVNGSGTAVAPSADSVSAGLAVAKANTDGITQRPDFASTSKTAYPLTVTDYAMVRTCGQSAAKATAVSSLLDKVAGSQDYGVTPGTIAPGYQGLTATQLTQLATAKKAIGSAKCPAADTTTAPAKTGGSKNAATTGTTNDGNNGSGTGSGDGSGSGSGSNGGSGSGAGSGSGGSGAGASGSGAGTKSGTKSGAKSSATKNTPSSTSSEPAASQAAAFNRNADSSGPARFTLPILLGVGGLLLIGGPAAFLMMSGDVGARLKLRRRR